jgi:hypothetical protein
MLAERNDRDHRRLREDVADIRRLQKHRRRDADDHDQDHEDKDWTRAQEAEGERNQGGARSALAPLGLQRHRRPVLHPISRVVFIIDKDRQFRRSQAVFYGLKTGLSSFEVDE